MISSGTLAAAPTTHVSHDIAVIHDPTGTGPFTHACFSIDVLMNEVGYFENWSVNVVGAFRVFVVGVLLVAVGCGFVEGSCRCSGKQFL
jgi:hypothetical protein